MLPTGFQQLAWVVDDLEAAQHYWMDVAGVPTFYEMHGLSARRVKSVYRGEPGTWTCDVSIGYHGDTMIELIRPQDGPSVWHEFIAKGRTGPHHVGYLVDDLAEDRKVLDAAGFDEVMTIHADGVEAIYFDTTSNHGIYTELIELDDTGRAFFEAMKHPS